MRLFSKIENSKDITDKEYVDKFYKKPTSGIPKSDLASAVQTSLGKADAAVPNTRKVNNKALSSDITLSADDVGALPDTTVIPTKVSDLTNDSGFTTNTGTVTSVSVKMNGETKGPVTSSGTIDLGTVLTDASKFATSAQGTKADNAVPNTRKVNNKALSSDITLGAADVGVTETAFPGLKKTGTVTGVKMNGTTKNPSSGVVDLGTVITAHQSLDGKQDKITSSNKLSASLVSGLATVATSGSYNDLSNKPTINGVEITGTKTSTDLKLGEVTANGGFQAGSTASATYGGAVGGGASANTGGAIGSSASATTGGAAGQGANATHGGAVGNSASAINGGAVGSGASATYGGAVGDSASATFGGAVGYFASATYGGAVGDGAKVTTGFAGGFNAKAQYKADGTTEVRGAVAIGADAVAQANNAVQLSTGTNANEGSLQFRDYPLVDVNGKIPADRLPGAGTSLGGVKTGGDVTITDGVITVSDDSHNHVISNIDGLQTELSGKANLNGGNTFTGKQTLNSPASDGCSINASGYIKGSLLQSSATSNKGANTGKVCVFDDAGWIYYRTPAEILTEAGGATTSQVNAKYTKPDDGIPKTDLESAVQTSLGKADNAMPKKGGTFTGEVKFGSTENFQGYYIKRMLGYLGAGTAYNNLDSSYKDGTWHRMWRLRFPSGSNFWGKIKITLYGGYSSFNASGVMSKSITCNFNTSSIYNNVGCYDGLGVNVEQDFRISEAIWNATASAWEVLIWQQHLNGNNSPAIMLECWTTNNTNYINAFNGIAAQTVELTQSTSYSAQKASSTGGTKTVTWEALPVYENPLGEEIATVAMLEDKQDKITSSNKLAASLVSGLATVATSGSYNDLSNKPTIPTVNNGKLTIQKNGTDVATFTANQSTNVTANITVPTKVSEITNDSGYTTNKGTVTSVAVKMNGSEKGKVTSSGTIDLGTVITSHQDISGKLDKTTYEWNKEFRAGSNGAISLGRYNVYDTQLTFDISSTTTISMNGKFVIATQNGRICQAKVFGDATGVLVSKIVIYQSAIVNNRSWVEVFCNFDGWSKNKVHIYGVSLESATVTNQMSSVTFTNGVPSPITSGDSKWSGTIDNDLSGKANLSGGNTFTGKQTLNSPASDGYSINAAGYIKGSWLQAFATSNKGANTGKVCVFDDNGWIYYRTPAEILTEAGGAKTSDIPTLQWVTPTSQAEITSAIMWKVEGQTIDSKDGSTNVTYTLYGIGSGTYGTVCASGNSRYGAVQLVFGANTYWTIRGTVMLNNQAVKPLPSTSVQGVDLSKWKILKYA